MKSFGYWDEYKTEAEETSVESSLPADFPKYGVIDDVGNGDLDTDPEEK